MTVTLSDPGSLLVCHPSLAEASLIESLRGECGVILQTIDWITRQLGFDLIGAIFDPIAGDFSAVDGMRQSWQDVSAALRETGDNYTALADGVPQIWQAASADLAIARLRRMGSAHHVQAEAAALMADQLANMLSAVTEACKLVAGVLGVLEELVLSLSLAKWMKEIATMGSGVRRAISLIHRAIEFIKNLNQVIPPILKAAGILALMFKAMNLSFMMPAAAHAHYSAAHRVDETARAGFDDETFPGNGD
jgi:hypothetical protein